MLSTLLFATAFAGDRSDTSIALDGPVDCGAVHSRWSYEWFVCRYGFPGEGDDDNNCDLRENSGSHYPTNARCFNTGTCGGILGNTLQDLADQQPYQGGTCICADVSKDGNWGTLYQPWWPNGKYSNTLCNKEHTEISARVSYIFYLPYNDAPSGSFGITGKLTCKTGSGAGVPYAVGADYQTDPRMLAMVRGTINYPESVDLAADGYVNYKGLIVESGKDSGQTEHCRICSDSNQCKRASSSTQPQDVYGTDDGTRPGETGNGGYVMVTFASDFNTFYDRGCARANNEIPTDSGGTPCALNVDRGLNASIAWTGATQGDDGGSHHQEHYHHSAEEPTSFPVTPPGVNDPDVVAYGLGWEGVGIGLRAVFFTQAQESQDITKAIPLPTRSPTKPPTDMPTPPPSEDDCFAMGYTHQKTDITFKGIGDDCRGGLLAEWPGGNSQDMCDSPYVICLPKENTPNAGFPLDGWSRASQTPQDDYEPNNHAYSIDECRKECAYDQRCTGFEFWVTSAGNTGFCSLIDDIPVIISGLVAGSDATAEGDLPADLSGVGGRLCFAKEQACNPYFPASDLSEAMLNCYCPDNRKGFYTKKVHRTVEATKYCGNNVDDPGVDSRIKEAQANRMFHLCENWCLFNTQDPRRESWYHDPWNKCWREQYAGVGTHRSYCYRVIRDPMTIEQLFIDTRSSKMCDASKDGVANPGNGNSIVPNNNSGNAAITWRMAGAEDSCDDVCGDNSQLCDSGATAAGSVGSAQFTAAGVTCSSTSQGPKGWALPGAADDGSCLTRHPDTDVNTGCNLSIGVGYRRLCACFST